MEELEFSWKTGDGSLIHALEWEPEGASTAVVALVHGIGEHVRRYEHVARAFAEAGIGLVAFDLPGHGRSGGKRGHASFALIREQIDQLIEEGHARFPGLPLFLYGHSLGGCLGLDYVLERKPAIAGAVIASPAIAMATPVPAPKVFLAKMMSRIAPSFSLGNGLDRSGISRDPEVIRKYVEDPLVHDRVSARLGLDILLAGPRIMGRAAEIKLPLLLVQGSADRITDPAAIASFASSCGKNVEYLSYEGCYHELHNEPGKEEFMKAVIAWIKGKRG